LGNHAGSPAVAGKKSGMVQGSAGLGRQGGRQAAEGPQPEERLLRVPDEGAENACLQMQAAEHMLVEIGEEQAIATDPEVLAGCGQRRSRIAPECQARSRSRANGRADHPWPGAPRSSWGAGGSCLQGRPPASRQEWSWPAGPPLEIERFPRLERYGNRRDGEVGQASGPAAARTAGMMKEEDTFTRFLQGVQGARVRRRVRAGSARVPWHPAFSAPLPFSFPGARTSRPPGPGWRDWGFRTGSCPG
jgi:hypothetical protein